MNNPRTSIVALCVSAVCLVGIAGYEGYRGEAYRDVTGIPTIGYGDTAGVKIGQKTTPDRALVQLLASANKHAGAVRQCVKVPLYQHEFDAYVSLAYNIGPAAFCGSTLVKKLNTGRQYAEACKEILRWNKAGGQVVPGLTKRRQTEYRMCMGEAV